MNLSELRREYTLGGLKKEDLAPDPVEQFALWFEQARNAELLEPNAFTLCTAAADGTPTGRTVLLKGFDASGFAFFTNYQSRKAEQLGENPRASALFPWLELQRQVVIEGGVERVSREETEEYFAKRPRGSQLGAHISLQSQVIDDRQEMEREMARLLREYAKKPIPTPEHWGGYRIKPVRVEFWQGRESRLHDRLLYRRQGDEWVIERLAP